MRLLEQLKRSCITHRSRPAIESEELILSYGELWHRSDQVARFVRSATTSRVSRVALLMENSPWWVASYVGIVKAGATVVPIHCASSVIETAAILDTARCTLVLCSAPTQQVAHDAIRDVGSGIGVLAVDATSLDATPQLRVDLQRAKQSVLAMPFTSGTTGRPKGVMTTDRSINASIVNSTVAFGLGAGQCNLVTGPLSSHPVFVGHVLTPLFLGGTVVLRPRFDADEVAELLLAGSIDFVAHVPTTLGRTIRALGGREVPHGSTHMVGAASVTRPLLQEAIERFGTVVQGWGMTETTNIVTCTNRVDFRRAELPWGRVLSSGIALPGGVVAIGLPDGTVTDAVPGSEGEGVIRGPIVAHGYFGTADRGGFRVADHEFWSGDIVRINEHGGLEVVGRVKDIIISGGMNVSPIEVESVLAAHPSCQEVAVIGVPDPDWGESLVAVVEGAPGALNAEEDLLRHARRFLAPYKRPKRIILVEAIPHNATGKVAKSQLADLVAGRFASQTSEES